MRKIGYTIILGWMYDLELKLAETVCLAVIFGFSKDGKSVYNGSRRYLAKKMCVKDTKTVDKAVASLSNLGLVDKIPIEENGIRFAEYRVTPYCLELAAASDGYEKNPQGAENITDTEEEMESTLDKMEITKKRNTKDNKSDSSALFDLVSAFVAELGVDPKAASDWATARKTLGMHESETAYRRTVAEIMKACETRHVTPTDCVEYAVFRGWKTFEASYEWTERESHSKKPVTIL